MPEPIAKQITIAAADGSSPLPYDLLVDAQDRVQWWDHADSDDPMPPGKPVFHEWRFWGGGMGETQDLARGGYYFSENMYHGDPFALKPRPTISTVTLTGNTVPIERMFHAKDANNNYYLYSLAQAKSFKVKVSDQTLVKTKDFTSSIPRFKTGTYVGNGADNRAIKGLGFQPDIVFLKGDYIGAGIFKVASMPASDAKRWTLEAVGAVGLKSFDADGFTVDRLWCNENGEVYFWVAWEDTAGYVKQGTYTGDGNDDRSITGVGFQPDLVIVAGDSNTEIVCRPSTLAGDKTQHWRTTGADAADHIQALEAGGFQLGTDADVNSNGVTYYYVAFKQLAEFFKVGTYAGDDADDRSLTGIGFPAEYAIIKTNSQAGVHRSDRNKKDSTTYFGAPANVADRIQALELDGFQVGTDAEVNASGSTYHYMAFGGEGTPSCGNAERWDGIWELALGEHMNVHGLTFVGVDTADDTWTKRPRLKAKYLQRLKNKIAKAYEGNKVSLCAADNIALPANWGAEYPVGPPGTVITDLLEWAAELLVPCTDGMYRFDGVATSKQQLPLMGGVEDDDNGKNSLVWGSIVLIPTADGRWRWQHGAHKTVGADSIRGYVPAKETSNEPIHLKHYGSAFLGDHIYDAAYDGTNYLIFYSRPVGDTFIIDCLISTTNAIKCLHIDPDRRLWFGWGNDLAWIQLSKGGAPDGGNFGNVSLVSTCYLPEKVLADDVEVRLRAFKVNARNMDVGGANAYKWEIHASRDGAAFGAQIGADIQGAAMDGVNKRYWTAASNLTARRLRPKLVGTATAGYTPTTTVPEIIGIEFRGETKPDDAEIIKCVLDLNGQGRTPKKIRTEIAAHRNAGVRQVRNPISNEVESVIIYDTETVMVTQKGHESPKAGLMIYMRRGDTS